MPRNPLWSRKLSRTLTLDDDTRVLTLQDAADAIQRDFAGTTKSGSLEATIKALMLAAQSGNRADITAATDQIERTLSVRHVLKREVDA